MYFSYREYVIIWSTFSTLIIETKRPTSKRQVSTWQLECELGIINDPDCPVDGGWSPWSPWSPCQGPCDDVGHRHRTRECSNPPPSQGGTPCSGSDEQSEICYLTNCTVNDFKNLISGDAARMKALLYLEAVPALMERCLQTECPFEVIEASLTLDNTWQLNSESLWNALQCVKRNLGCSVTGDWGTWGTWSACGALCGRGLRWRIRRCNTPPPSDASLICTGTPLQAESCIGNQCAINSYGSGGSWDDWSSWSSCSENCGTGVKRRKRICHETNTSYAFDTWGTHCRGQHDQLEVCENLVCNIEGGWSGWGGWGPCSQSCGAGKRTRTRSCTRPIPSGNGKPCVGSKTETGSCHLIPCTGFSHTVAIFHGESFLHYDFSNKRAALYHFYMRFIPLSPHGTLARREAGEGSYVHLSLQKWHICLDACGASRSCCLPRSCTRSNIDTAVWHSVLVTVSNEGALLRLDDRPAGIKSAWPCDPQLPDDKLNIYVGEKFQGHIQEIILNFIPLMMIANRNQRALQSDFSPIEASNIAYEKASIMEAYLRIEHDNYLRLPCFQNQDEWKLELTLKPKKEAGTILFLKNDNNANWLHVVLQNSRLRLKLALGNFKTESVSTTECLPDNWLDVILAKTQEKNAIEASINAGEHLHVLFEAEKARRRRTYISNNSNKIQDKINATGREQETFDLCTDEFFIGGVSNEVKQKIVLEDYAPFSGVIASVRVNKNLIDLYDSNLERYKDNKIQVSSRTASVSGSYHETAWGKSNHLNLTCLHARTTRTPHTAGWLFIDTTVIGALEDRPLRSIDDGRVLRLIATADNDLRGFYTCRAHSNRRTSNIVTYGVLGKIQYKLHDPDRTTAFAVVTTLTLVFGTLLWLFIEGVHDLRNGHGFYRDAHLFPEEEADAVCKYIDQNIDSIGSKSLAQMAKAKARRRARQLAASRSDFTAQGPLSLRKKNLDSEQLLNTSNYEVLPALPEVRSCGREINHDVYRFEPCYIRSPRHGSLTSPKSRMSSSSFELVSPRVLSSKLLMARALRSSRECLNSRKKVIGRSLLQGKPRSSLAAIKSSSSMNLTPGQKILQKFRELKGDDV